MLNLLWPCSRRPAVQGFGALGRFIHWIGVVAALLCALMALEFSVEGWAVSLARTLVLAALGLVVGSRAILFMLTHE